MNEKGNAKLYGIRFDLNHQVSSASPTDCQWFLTPYAWLEKDDQWYLIKIFTPWFANLFPRFITKFPHQAWQVTPDEVLNNDIFRLHEYHKREITDTTAKTAGVADFITSTGLVASFLSFLAAIVPAKNPLSFGISYVVYFFTILVTCLIIPILGKLSSKWLTKSFRKSIFNYDDLKANVNNISETHKQISVYISSIKPFNLLTIFKKIIAISFFLFLFIPISIAIQGNETRIVVAMGIIMAFSFYAFIISGCFLLSPRELVSNHVDQIIVSKIE